MAGHRYQSFEVLQRVGARWTIDAVMDDEAAALRHAEGLLASRQYDGVKVIGERVGGRETVLFEKDSPVAVGKPITIADVTDAPMCTTLADFLQFPARRTLGRLLRQFLDQHGMTPLEFMYDRGKIREFQRNESLYNQAAHRIASIQARTEGVDQTERLDLMFALGGQLMDNVQTLGNVEKAWQRANEHSFAAVVTTLKNRYMDEYAENMARATVARQLQEGADWPAKLIAVVSWLEKDPEEIGRNHLDEAIAEIMDGATAVKDILGYQPDLGVALRTIADLAMACYPAGRDTTSAVARLNLLMAAVDLPRTRQTLLERVARGLRGLRPLTRESDRHDRDSFAAILKRLIQPAGLAGGPDMAEAVLRRARSVLSSDYQNLTPHQGLREVSAQLPTPACRIGFLVDLLHSGFGTTNRKVVLNALMETLRLVGHMRDLLPAGATRDDTVAVVADLKARLAHESFPADLGDLLGAKLDRLAEGQQDSGLDAAIAAAEALEPAPAPVQVDPSGRRTVRPGQLLFKQGDPGDEAYIVVSGSAEIVFMPEEGKERILNRIRRGDIVGEMALISNTARMASVRAIEPLVVTTVPKSVFDSKLDRLTDTDPLLRNVLDTLVTRLRDIQTS